MATYNSTDWLKAKYNNQEVVKIILNGVTSWEEPDDSPSVPYTVWSGNTTLYVNDTLSVGDLSSSKTGTVYKITFPNFGDLYCTQQSNGEINGSIYPTGDPVNGQYYLWLSVGFEVLSNKTQIKIRLNTFQEGQSYPNYDYLDTNFGLWITKIEVVSW